jgi:isopenicillin N synthase-like dioxygenase
MPLTNLVPQNVARKIIEEKFIILRLPEVIWESVSTTLTAAVPFFREPLALKSICSFPQDMGYRPIGGEYSQSSAYPDQLESFSISARVPIPLAALPSENARILYKRMFATFNLLEPVAEALAMEFAKGVSGGPAGGKLRGALRNWSRLQLNYARPSEVKVPFVNALHDDLNLLTINFADGPGLEVGISEDAVVEVSRAPCEAVVLPGEISWLLSGGVIKPLYHRVRANPDVPERLALLFFADPDPEACSPWVVNEVNKDIDIGNRVRLNVHRFGLQGFTE